MKRISLYIIMLLSINLAYSQKTLSPHALKSLDEGLMQLSMLRSDLYLPGDYVEDDIYRLKAIKSFFDNPLMMMDKGEEYQKLCPEANDGNIEKIIDEISKDLELKPLKAIDISIPYGSEEVNRILRANVDSIMNTFESLILKQYLAPALRANEAFYYDAIYKDLKVKKFLIENIQEIVYEEEGAETESNVYEAQSNQYKTFQKALKFFDNAILINNSEAHLIGNALYKKILEATLKVESNKEAVKDNLKTTLIETRLGKIAIGGFGNDIYSGDFFLIVDLGGDDIYNIEGINPVSQKRSISCIIDYEGNDIYNGGDNTLGGALFGVNILIDKKGNDIYKGGDNSLGSAIFGMGILHDLEGMDSYNSKSFSQGSGAFGIGLLLDNTGSDIYNSYSNSQGFGYVKGFGMISDKSGNDIYTSLSPTVDILRYEDHFISFSQGASIGYRPIASGGIGIISDLTGNDNYISDIYGQGTAYWFSFGALMDNSGDDKYQSYQYAQGSGVHFAHAYLRDKKGNDVYVSHGVSQGCGHDIASGILLDEEGDDQYLSESLSMGAGNANAISILLDLAGNDSYFATNLTNSMGFSDFRRGYGMIGLFIDAEGNDYYGSPKNDIVLIKSTSGLMADLNIKNDKKIDANKAEDEQIYQPLSNSTDSLFAQASASYLKFQNNVEPARKKIAESGIIAIPFLASKFNTIFPRERIALEEILVKMYEIDSIIVTKTVLDSINSQDYHTLMLMIEVAGRKKIQGSLEKLTDLLNSNDWRIRASAAHKIGLIGNSGYAEALTKTLNDEHPLPRAYAAYSIAVLNYPEINSFSASLFNDQNQIVRTNFLQGLLKSKIDLDKYQSLSNLNIDDYYKKELMKGLSISKMNSEELSVFKKKFKALTKEQRKAIYLSLLEDNNEENVEIVKSLTSKTEKDKDLQKMIIQKINNR